MMARNKGKRRWIEPSTIAPAMVQVASNWFFMGCRAEKGNREQCCSTGESSPQSFCDRLYKK